MRIVKIWDADYPWDIRVEKVIKALSRSGHSVSVVCRNLKCLPTCETIENVEFFRLPFVRNQRLNKFISFPYFLNPLWLNTIYRVTAHQRGQAILVRDLPLALAAILVGKFLRVPVIIDMAENYPSMLKDSRKLGRLRRTDILVRNVQFAKLAESLTVRGVEKIIVVAEENKERLLEKGVPANDIYLVRNTPDLDMLDNSRDCVEASEKMHFVDRFTLAYVGALGPVRGLEMVVEAMPKIIQKIPEAHLLLIGQGEKEPTLQKLVSKHKIADHVTFKGWLDFHHVPGYLSLANVGIIPHRSTEHTNSTIPNKIFDYMALGLPVVASDIRPLRRIIAEENCGITFQAGNLDDFVSAITRIYVKNEGNTFGENGRRAVERKYSWNEDSLILLKVFADLEASATSSPKES